MRTPPSLRAFADCQRGGVAIEFGLVGLAFFALVLGTVEFGRALYLRSDLVAAADAGARAALLDPEVSDVALEAAVRSAFIAAGTDAASVAITSGTAANGVPAREITVALPMRLLIPGLSTDTVTLSATRRIPAL